MTPGSTPVSEPPAGFVSRLIALAVDLALLGLVLGGLEWLIQAVERLMLARLLPTLQLSTAVIALIRAAIAVAYFVLSWSVFGQTPGKWLLGLRVTGPDGKPPAIGRALLRLLGYPLSALPLYLGFLWVLIDPQRRAWHDLLARTRVLYAAGRGPAAAGVRLPAFQSRRDLLD